MLLRVEREEKRERMLLRKMVKNLTRKEMNLRRLLRREEKQERMLPRVVQKKSTGSGTQPKKSTGSKGSGDGKKGTPPKGSKAKKETTFFFTKKSAFSGKAEWIAHDIKVDNKNLILTPAGKKAKNHPLNSFKTVEQEEGDEGFVLTVTDSKNKQMKFKFTEEDKCTEVKEKN